MPRPSVVPRWRNSGRGLPSSRSVFTGFVVDDAAATFQGVARVSPDSAGNIRAAVEYLRKKALKGIDRDPNAPAALKDIVNGVLDVVDQTVQEGKSEIGASVVLAPNSFQFVAGRTRGRRSSPGRRISESCTNWPSNSRTCRR